MVRSPVYLTLQRNSYRGLARLEAQRPSAMVAESGGLTARVAAQLSIDDVKAAAVALQHPAMAGQHFEQELGLRAKASESQYRVSDAGHRRSAEDDSPGSTSGSSCNTGGADESETPVLLRRRNSDAAAVAEAPLAQGFSSPGLHGYSSQALMHTTGSLSISRAASEASYGGSSAAPLPAVPDCPLCGKRMTDPVMAESGHTYDRECIEAWMAENDPPTDPTTGQVLTNLTLVPNFVMKDIIKQGLRQGEKLVFPGAAAPVGRLAPPPPPSMPSEPLGAPAEYDIVDGPANTQVEQPAPEDDFDTLFELLSGKVPDLQEEALRMLLAMMREGPDKIQSLLSQGVVLGLASVLENGQPTGQSMAVDVLAQLMASGPSSCVSMLVDAGVMQSLTSMLLSPSPLCQTQAIGLLSQLTMRYGPAQRLSDEGGLGAVVQLLGGDNATCREYAACTLSAVARHGEELTLLIARTNGAIPALVPLLRSGDAVCQERAAYVLAQVTRLGPEYEAAIAGFPLIDPLVQLLYFGQDDTKAYAAQLLGALCRTNTRNRAMVALAGGAVPLLKMLVSTERAQQVAAGELLMHLEQVKESRKDVHNAFKQLDRDYQKLIKRAAKDLRLKLKF